MTSSMERMVKARAALLMTQPFWGALSLYLKLKEDPGCGTMWTDGQTLGFDPVFEEGLSEKERQGVIAHEVSHCAYNHHTRRGNRDPDMWNDAGDFAINRDLLRVPVTLPTPHLADPRFDGLCAEEIYGVLAKEKEKQPQGQGGNQTPAQGPENGPSKAQQGRWGEVRDAAPQHNKTEIARIENEWGTRVSQAIAAHRGKLAGNIPASLQKMFDAAKKPIPLDWRAFLRRFIDERTRLDYSWSRPNKRMLGIGFVVPGMIPDGVNHIGWITDTSGSIDRVAHSQCVHQLQAMMDEGIIGKLTYICCDTDVKSVQEFQNGDQIVPKVVGGGGTRFGPALAWFAKNAPDVAAIVYFTDLECSDFGEEPCVPLLWLAYGSPDSTHRLAENVPFGEVVQLLAE